MLFVMADREANGNPSVPVQWAAQMMQVNRRTIYRWLENRKVELIVLRGRKRVSLRSLRGASERLRNEPADGSDLT